MVTKMGFIKIVSLKEFSKPRSSGLIAINLNNTDSLISVNIFIDNEEIKVDELCPTLVEMHPREFERSVYREIEIIAEEDVKIGCINAIKQELRKSDLLKVRYKIRRKLFD